MIYLLGNDKEIIISTTEMELFSFYVVGNGIDQTGPKCSGSERQLHEETGLWGFVRGDSTAHHATLAGFDSLCRICMIGSVVSDLTVYHIVGPGFSFDQNPVVGKLQSHVLPPFTYSSGVQHKGDFRPRHPITAHVLT